MKPKYIVAAEVAQCVVLCEYKKFDAAAKFFKSEKRAFLIRATDDVSLYEETPKCYKRALVFVDKDGSFGFFHNFKNNEQFESKKKDLLSDTALDVLDFWYGGELSTIIYK